MYLFINGLDVVQVRFGFRGDVVIDVRREEVNDNLFLKPNLRLAAKGLEFTEPNPTGDSLCVVACQYNDLPDNDKVGKRFCFVCEILSHNRGQHIRWR